MTSSYDLEKQSIIKPLDYDQLPENFKNLEVNSKYIILGLFLSGALISVLQFGPQGTMSLKTYIL